MAMLTPAEVRQTVEDVVGNKGDDTVFEYVVSILEDGEFEFGQDGKDAFEAFGAVLVCWVTVSAFSGARLHVRQLRVGLTALT